MAPFRLLQVLEVDRGEGRRLTRRRSRSKFDEANLQRFGQQAGSNLKRAAQHKSGKITLSGPQQFFSGAVFDFEINSSVIPRIHFVCLPFFEYLYLLV